MNELDATLAEAGRKLEADLERIFAPLVDSMLPEAAVETIHSYGMAEDGETLVVMVEMADGHTACFQFCPGGPITAHVIT